MRKKKLERDSNFAYSVAEQSDYGVIATTDSEGKPYAVPVHFVRDGDSLCFHAALVGKKAECMRRHPEVSVACVSSVSFPPEYFDTEYDSAIFSGRVETVEDESEKRRILRLISERYCAVKMADFEAEADKSLRALGIWRIRVSEAVGKQKRFPKK